MLLCESAKQYSDNNKLKIMKILVAEDHILFREGLSLILENLADSVDVFQGDDFDSACQLIKMHADFDLILLGLPIAGSESFAALQYFGSFFHSGVGCGLPASGRCREGATSSMCGT